MSTSEDGTPGVQTPDTALPGPSIDTPKTRTIHAFLGGQPRASTSASAAADKVEQPKRKRKKEEKAGGPSQGRIVLNGNGASTWTVGRKQEGDTASVGSGSTATDKGKGKAAKRSGGEEEEMKEMGKKAKASKVGTTAPRGRKGKGRSGTTTAQQSNGTGRLELRGDEDGPDDDLAELDNQPDSNKAPTPSPSKKRGQPLKAAPTTSSKARKGTRSTSTARDVSPDYEIVRSSSPNDVIITGASALSRLNGGDRLARAGTGTTASLRGSTHRDAIDVEDEPVKSKPGPKKYAFASDAKPAHSFFGRLGPASASKDPSADVSKANSPMPTTDKPDKVTGGQIADVLDSGADASVNVNDQMTSQQPSKPAMQVHNFFKPNGAAAKAGELKKGWGRGVKEGEEWLAPLPSGAWPQSEPTIHETPQAGPSTPRRPRVHRPASNDPTFWQGILSHSAVEDEVDSQEKRPRRRPINMPASNRETYGERYRPRTASEVLGNQTEATYLRDWLSALSVGNQDAGGRRVVRRVPKKRRIVDDWIVDDIGLYGAPEEEIVEDEVPEPYEEPNVPLGQRPAWYTPLSAYLANSILLTGPSGTGKSAAVYAAANELGWEVFEVYPGIGKRTGGNLMSLVGDVGKNHMVGKGKEKEKEKAVDSPARGLKTFFKPKHGGEDDDGAPPPGSQGEPIEVDDDHPDRPVTPPPRLRNSSVNLTPFRDESKFRQSLILIEEVDILFEEEATFWPAVVALIAESRRPVVMTCNDIENVALDSLPLQAILQFQPPTREQAVQCLLSVCEAEGIAGDPVASYVAELYDRSVVRAPHLVATPGPPNGHEWLPHFDLRRAIMQIQLDRGRRRADSNDSQDVKDLDFAQCARRADLASYSDAHLEPRPWAVMEINELDRYRATPDDQLGEITLRKTELSDTVPILPAYDRSSEIASCLSTSDEARRSQQTFLLSDQILHIRSLLPLLDPIIPLSSHLLPHPSLFVDYMPAIENMIQIDDIREAEYEAAKAAGEDVRNFKTGRPMRVTAWLGKEGFTRQLELDDAALVVGRRRLRYEDEESHTT